MQESRQLSQAEASLSCSIGLSAPRKPPHAWFASVSQGKKVPIWHKKEDTVFQAIVCASQILLTPQLLVKRNEYI